MPHREVTTWSRGAKSGTTDATGAFTITGLSDGTFNLAVVPEEQFTKEFTDAKVEVGVGESLSGVEIVYPG